jgi:hypothetical protein
MCPSSTFLVTRSFTIATAGLTITSLMPVHCYGFCFWHLQQHHAVDYVFFIFRTFKAFYHFGIELFVPSMNYGTKSFIEIWSYKNASKEER